MAGSEKKKITFVFNAPVTLGFFFICLLAMGLDYVTKGWTTDHIFKVYRSSLANPMTYVRLIGHVFGHANWQHFIGNMTYILLLGPTLEEKYGSKNMVEMIGIAAVITGAIYMIFFPDKALLGASGVVFAMIVMSSLTNFKSGSIPVTFVLMAIIFIIPEIYKGLFVPSNVSNLGHVIGGSVGALSGFMLNGEKKGK